MSDFISISILNSWLTEKHKVQKETFKQFGEQNQKSLCAEEVCMCMVWQVTVLAKIRMFASGGTNSLNVLNMLCLSQSVFLIPFNRSPLISNGSSRDKFQSYERWINCPIWFSPQCLESKFDKGNISNVQPGHTLAERIVKILWDKRTKNFHF